MFFKEKNFEIISNTYKLIQGKYKKTKYSAIFKKQNFQQ